jgi:hypothetical protein
MSSGLKDRPFNECSPRINVMASMGLFLKYIHPNTKKLSSYNSNVLLP